MNYAVILTGGVGQRMRNSGLPKQFIKLFGKPIIIYTLERFQASSDIDQIIVVSHSAWTDKMEKLVSEFGISKVKSIVVGGVDRLQSVIRGVEEVRKAGRGTDIIVIHDGVRPLVSQKTIHDNVRVAKKHGNAMTVTPVTESVIVAKGKTAGISEFMKREDTFTLTSPQSFKLKDLNDAFLRLDKISNPRIPLLDVSIIFAELGHKIHLVYEQEHNIKITTPEDFYYLRSILELEESKIIFGL